VDAMAAPPRYADPRRRITAAVFVAVALGTVGLFAAITVAPLAAVELTGSSRLSGVPTAAALAGTALGAAILARVMATRGRRPGLVLGFGLGASGAVLAVLSIVLGVFWPFVIGMLVLGCGNGANLQARYAVAEVQPSERRTTVLGWVVWAGTIGAVVGPSLVDPAGLTLSVWGLPALAGGAAIAAVGMTSSAAVLLAFLRPDPSELADLAAPGAMPAPDDEPAEVVSGWRSPVVIVAVVAMVAGQFVMVLIMTMTPVHASGAGASLGAVGFIMSAHIVGMYGLTPVAGFLADRIGSVTVIGVGLALTVVAGLLGAVVPAADVMLLSVALFILGLGWSFGFVAASGLLAAGVASAERARLQGSVDTAVYAAATIGSLSSGVLIAAAGYAALCLVGAALVAVPAVVLARLWRPVTAAIRPA
jgi:MFS family permease